MDYVKETNIKKRVVIEAASSYGWEKYAGDQGKIISIDEYGFSGQPKELMKYYGFEAEQILRELENFLELQLV